MAFLVSGASGFVGRRLVSRLSANGSEVIAIARTSIPSNLRSNPYIQWIVTDIANEALDLPSLPNIEAVIQDRKSVV